MPGIETTTDLDTVARWLEEYVLARGGPESKARVRFTRTHYGELTRIQVEVRVDCVSTILGAQIDIIKPNDVRDIKRQAESL